MKVRQAAEKWGISDRRVRILCEQGKIEGVEQKGRRYLIPINAVKPIDRRSRRGKIISPEALVILDLIDLRKADMNSRPPMPLGDYNQMLKDFMIFTTYHSSALGGNTFTLADTAALFSGAVIPGKSLKEHLEIAGYRDAFLHVRNLSQGHLKLTARTIKELHALLMIDRPKDKGTYRRTETSVHGSTYPLTSPNMIYSHMEELLSSWNKSSLHPIERAALFHLKFEMIHPFQDGNGRVGLLLLNLLLMNQGYPAVIIRIEDKDRYYKAFLDFCESGTAIPLLQLIEERMVERINNCIAKRKRIASSERLTLS